MDNPDLIRIKQEIKRKKRQNQKPKKRNNKIVKYLGYIVYLDSM